MLGGKAGEMLKKMEKNPGKLKNSRSNIVLPRKLDDLEISHKRANRNPYHDGRGFT